jgi:3D (Asp-Asp-Asp) domain-containing protein
MRSSKLILSIVCLALFLTLAYSYIKSQELSKKIDTLQAEHLEEQEKTNQLKSEVKELQNNEAELSEALKGQTQRLEQSESELKKSKENMKELEKVNSDLQKRNADLKKENQELSYKKQLEKEKQSSSPSGRTVAVSKPKDMPQVSRGSTDSSKTITMESTAYTAYCNGCSGVTASGVNLRTNPNARVVAVDPNVIPLGTKVHVEGYGYAVASDTGGAIKGNRIDIFFPSKEQAFSWGRKNIQVKILN